VSSNKVISIDAMGGDNSPGAIIEGLSIVLNNFDNFSAILFGDKDKIKSEIKKNFISENKIEIIHCEKVVPMDAKPIDAIRKIGKESSMWGCIKSVSDGNADVAISAGNTGALMGLSAIILKKLEGIERPAIASYWPNINGRSVVLDLGGNIEVSSDQLVQFGILGYAHALSALENQNPSIGLLNIGHEEMKGTENIQEASKKMTNLFNENYIGYVEGDDISLGKSDVVVTDGFTGNIALKTAEGTAKLIAHFMSDAFKKSFLGKLSYLVGIKSFQILKDKMDPRELNGGVFLGLNGLVVKSHGGTDALGFSKALEFSLKLNQSKMSKTIESLVNKNI
jgi:glycerol-3-phosphate acyltransferase PlsX